jgi:hypothetical protein
MWWCRSLLAGCRWAAVAVPRTTRGYWCWSCCCWCCCSLRLPRMWGRLLRPIELAYHLPAPPMWMWLWRSWAPPIHCWRRRQMQVGRLPSPRASAAHPSHQGTLQTGWGASGRPSLLVALPPSLYPLYQSSAGPRPLYQHWLAVSGHPDRPSRCYYQASVALPSLRYPRRPSHYLHRPTQACWRWWWWYPGFGWSCRMMLGRLK